MLKYRCLKHHFIEHIPDLLDPGVLYISMEYATAAHSCCCGCGEEVVTPLSPTDWNMIFDGETVSLHPSIGNWSLACRSHYVINCGRVIEAGASTNKQIEEWRHRERAAKTLYYAQGTTEVEPVTRKATPTPEPIENGIMSLFWRTITGRKA